MKKILFAFTTTLLLAACNNDSKDSVQKADSANAARIDSNASDHKTTIAADKETADFIVKALDGGITEVALGNIAKAKGQNPRVRAFGEMMITDHQAANDKIRSLASVRNVAIPSRAGDENADMIGKINKEDLTHFDKTYLDMMVDDHKNDIKEFEDAGNKITDTEVRQFINSTLPVLRKHLDSCTVIRAALEK